MGCCIGANQLLLGTITMMCVTTNCRFIVTVLCWERLLDSTGKPLVFMHASMAYLNGMITLLHAFALTGLARPFCRSTGCGSRHMWSDAWWSARQPHCTGCIPQAVMPDRQPPYMPK